MFTIKQVCKDFENIFEGNNPHFERKGMGGKPTVVFGTPDGLTCSIDAGDVFIMNSNGSTVSRYYLENSPSMPGGKAA
jgi:hypothetical protein